MWEECVCGVYGVCGFVQGVCTDVSLCEFLLWGTVYVLFVCLGLFYVLATYAVISGWASSYDSVLSCNFIELPNWEILLSGP